MIIKPDNLTKIMSIILHDPLCYDHSNYHSLNWPINNSSQYLCVPWWSIGMSNVTQYEFPNKTTEVWNSLFKYMFLLLLHHYQTICLLHILLCLFQDSTFDEFWNSGTQEIRQSKTMATRSTNRRMALNITSALLTSDTTCAPDVSPIDLGEIWPEIISNSTRNVGTIPLLWLSQ